MNKNRLRSILSDYKNGQSSLEETDPLQHLDQKMRCRTCEWFDANVPHKETGRCRRHAPTMKGYPVVFSGDWCGDHKLNKKTNNEKSNAEEMEYPRDVERKSNKKKWWACTCYCAGCGLESPCVVSQKYEPSGCVQCGDAKWIAIES